MKDTKSKVIIFLDSRYFQEGQRIELSNWLNDQLSWDKYKVLIIEFPSIDYSQIKTIDVN